jgi:hypothetical protein
MEPGDGAAGDCEESQDGADEQGGGAQVGVHGDGGATEHRGVHDGAAGDTSR